MLPYSIDFIFEEDGQHFWLRCPYDKGFIKAMSINMVEREWHKERKMFRFPSSEFECIYALIDQFYGAWKQVPVWGFMEGYNVQDTQAESLCNPKKSGHAKK